MKSPRMVVTSIYSYYSLTCMMHVLYMYIIYIGMYVIACTCVFFTHVGCTTRMNIYCKRGGGGNEYVTH